MDQNIRFFKKDEVIFREGAYERCMYEIAAGSVNIFVHYGEVDQQLLTTLGAGQYFGEIGITEVMARTATAVAAGDDTRLIEINSDNFGAYFSRDPQKLLVIMRHMSSRLRSLTQDYLEARQAVSDAVNAAKKGEGQSAGLKEKFSRMVQNFLKPSFLKAAAYDEAAFVGAHEGQERVVHSFGKNEIIFREGDEANCMYDIRYGSVGIYANYGKADQQLLTQLRYDEFFGEMGMLEKLPRSATAVSLDANTQVEVVSEETFNRFLRENSPRVMMIMMHLSSRLRILTKDYMAACRMAAEAVEAAEKAPERWTETVADYYQKVYESEEDAWDYYSSCYRWDNPRGRY